MAEIRYSIRRYTGTGIAQLLDVPAYLDKSHIEVYVSGVLSTAFTWVTSQTISLTATVGAAVVIQRRTSPDARLTDYQSGVTLTEGDLDADSLQAFYLSQEALDVYADVLGFAGAPLDTAIAAAVQANASAAASAGSAASAALAVTDLANLADPAKGAGKIGFTASLAYAAGTVGRWLKDLATSTGAGLIGFVQGGTGAVLRTVAVKLSDTVNVLDFGAKGDGVTDDSAAFSNAITAISNRGGGSVYVPSTGAAYCINTGLTLPNCVHLIGDGGQNWYGADQPFNVWPGKGTWLQPKDLINPCITVAGTGCKVRGINFIHNQPVPSATPGVAYVPTVYPWCIRVTQNFVELDDIHIVNGTHGIAWDYLSTNGGGTYCRMTNIFSGALQMGAWFHNINDTMVIRNIRERALWYVTNSNMVDYLEANKTGWWFNYIDNPQIDDVEFFQCQVAIRGTDSTVNAGAFNLTHACVLAQVGKIGFNLCVGGITLDTGTTKFSGTFGQVLAQSDTVTNRAAANFFNLASNNADVVFGTLTCPQVGRSLLSVGGGTAGRCVIGDLRLDNYSFLAAGLPAITVNAGALLDVPAGFQKVTRLAGAGAKVVGTGVVTTPLIHSDITADREGGTVSLVASAAGNDSSGFVAFFGTGSVERRGYIGNASPSAKELTVASDAGSLKLVSTPGGTIDIRSDGIIAFVNSAGVRKASLNLTTGNMILAGTLTQNGTP